MEEFGRRPGETAVVRHRGVRQERTSWSELAALSGRFAAELERRSIRPGERVLLWGPNSAEWMAAFFGCVLRGVLAVPLDAAGSAEFARRVARETQPRLAVGDRERLALLEPGLLEPGLPRIDFDDFPAALPETQAGALNTLARATPLQILFTSGTTAEPKGVVHTHGNVLASLDPIEREMQRYLKYERPFHPLRFLHTLPLSHVFGQFMGLWVPPLMGAEVHFEHRLQAARLMELIRRERISVLAAVPRVLELLQGEMEARFPDLAERRARLKGKRVWHRWWTLRDVHRAFGWKFWAFVCGGAALPGPLEEFWNEMGFALIQGYGMTETAALITLNHPFHIAKGSLGRPLPGREVKLGADGEVLVKGAMVARARWQNGHLQQADSEWLATGDLASRDAAGELRFVGRKSEVIVTAAGLNLHPEDVEAALNRQKGVAASAVVPGRGGAVAVLLWRGAGGEAQEAVEAANRELAEFQKVRRWRLWPEMDFPRSGLGKIQRRQVEAWVAAEDDAAQGDAKSDKSGAVDALSRRLAKLSGGEARPLEDSTCLDRELNLDSLARVQLQTELEEQLGRGIPDVEFEGIATVGQLRRLLGAVEARSEFPSRAANSPQTAQEGEFRYPRWAWSPAMQALRVAFLEGVMRPLVWLLASPRVVRRTQALPPGSLLIVANHVTAFDGALVLYALPGRVRRRVAVAMAGEMLDDYRHGRKQGNWALNGMAPAAYWLLTALFNVFPLPRGAGFRRSFQHAGEAMDRGYNVLVFPEGHRSAGALAEFRSGIGLLARETGASILPVAMAGLGELKRGAQSWFRSGRIRLTVGAVIAPDAALSAEELARLLHERVGELLEASQVSSASLR
ncbi:MAG: AMP-binding protein [Acidobacteriota bacterium]|nr:AMP-binding protein [Acidobacteriota bacterium]